MTEPGSLEFDGPVVTGVGSLPFTDPAEAVDVVARHCRVLPFWPQLPQRGSAELMVEQLVAGIDEGGALTPGSAAGFFAFEAAVRAGRFPDARCVKGHLVGPVTLATARPELDLAAATRAVFEAARWQLRRLQALGLPVMVWLDEPCAPVGASGAEWRAIHDVLDAVRGLGGVGGVHCCGEQPGPHLYPGVPQVFSFDAAHHLETFWEGNGQAVVNRAEWVAWGLVDATVDPGSVDVEALAQRWTAEPWLRQPSTQRRTIFTASCGLGLIDPGWVEPSFRLLQALCDAVTRRRHG